VPAGHHVSSPQFRFQHADLFNTAYNPRGVQQAAQYRFPYEDDSFDFAYLGSVCTHLLQGKPPLPARACPRAAARRQMRRELLPAQ